MIYLVAKIAVLLFMAAIFGAALMYYWLRRQFEDVSERYTLLEQHAIARQEEFAKVRAEMNDEWRAQLDARLQYIFDLLQEQSQSTRTVLDNVMEHLDTRFDGIEQHVNKSIHNLSKASALQRAESSSQLPIPANIDLQPMRAEIASVAASIESLRDIISSKPALSPFTPSHMDGSDKIFNERLDELEEKLASINPSSFDIASDKPVLIAEPIIQDLHANTSAHDLVIEPIIEDADVSLNNIPKMSEPASIWSTDTQNKEAHKTPQSSQNNLLMWPAYGDPDDLKKITGIGPVMERKLNECGVFYFWQIAEWSYEDSLDIDARLRAFSGRIQRDGWIEQATKLALEPNAAQPPEQKKTSSDPIVGAMTNNMTITPACVP